MNSGLENLDGREFIERNLLYNTIVYTIKLWERIELPIRNSVTIFLAVFISQLGRCFVELIDWQRRHFGLHRYRQAMHLC